MGGELPTPPDRAKARNRETVRCLTPGRPLVVFAPLRSPVASTVSRPRSAEHRRSIRGQRRICQAYPSKTARRTERNKHVRSTVRGSMKVREAIAAAEQSGAATALADAIEDRRGRPGVFHKNAGSRYVSRLSSQVAALKRPEGRSSERKLEPPPRPTGNRGGGSCRSVAPAPVFGKRRARRMRPT
ncbi:MAG: 30S ribosomal protein S20 [Sandaracinus sp.]